MAAAADPSSARAPDTPPSPDQGDGGAAGQTAPKAPSGKDEPDSAEAQPTLLGQLTSLYADGKALLESELSFQKGRVNYTVRAAKLGAIAVVVGIVALLCALITLLLGIFVSVWYYVGPVIALCTVPLAWALLGWLAFRYAGSRLRDAKAMIAETGGITGRKPDGPAAAMAKKASNTKGGSNG